MLAKIIEKKLVFYERTLLFEDENNVDELIVTAQRFYNEKDLSTFLAYAKLEFEDKSTSKEPMQMSIDDEEITLSLTFLRSQLGEGIIKIQVVFENSNDCILSTSIEDIVVNSSIDADSQIPLQNQNIVQSFSSHISNTDNPHKVTIEQLDGLPANTSYGKEISTEGEFLLLKDQNGNEISKTACIENKTITAKKTTLSNNLLPFCTIKKGYYKQDGTIADDGYHYYVKIPTSLINKGFLYVDRPTWYSLDEISITALDGEDNILECCSPLATLFTGEYISAYVQNTRIQNLAVNDYLSTIKILSSEVKYIVVNTSMPSKVVVKNIIQEDEYFGGELISKNDLPFHANLLNSAYKNTRFYLGLKGEMLGSNYLDFYLIDIRKTQGGIFLANFNLEETDGKCIFYDENLNFISCITSGTKFTAPQNACYLGLNTPIDDNNEKNLGLFIENGESEITINANAIYGDIVYHNLSNKIWCSLGDTMTRSGKWQSYVLSKFKTLTHINCGLDNSILTGSTGLTCDERLGIGEYENATLVTINDNTVNTLLPNNPDIITIWGGLYDLYSSLATIGDNSELDNELSSKNTATVYGALSYLVEKILSIKPTCKIVLMTQYEVQNNQTINFNLKKLNTAIKEVASYYSLPCVELDKCSFVNKNTFENYLINGVTPNNALYNQIGQYVVDILKNIT